ncbi:hypothetical protein [Maribacter polysaccharolyticus]|uniref:hypothetical protein n=1 Tax=Maribacter polysaccharolyticus TaxID=3020831 RepID=UPI00237F0B1E|nr:hypothetical protein [Maribacter polysaccharolyticus]MDE3741634.1 hypothetical protein [Maribacter polysaccharolyticus]
MVFSAQGSGSLKDAEPISGHLGNKQCLSYTYGQPWIGMEGRRPKIDMDKQGSTYLEENKSKVSENHFDQGAVTFLSFLKNG